VPIRFDLFLSKYLTPYSETRSNAHIDETSDGEDDRRAHALLQEAFIGMVRLLFNCFLTKFY